MEQQTKNCPYCGEEIMATAKKCKHCGEWLNQNAEQTEMAEIATQEDETEKAQEPLVAVSSEMIAKYSKICFWVAVLGAFISFVHEVGIKAGHSGGKRANGLIMLANSIPEQVGNILEALGFMGLLLLLMKLAKIFGKPLKNLCGTAIALEAYLALFTIIDNESDMASLADILTPILMLIDLVILLVIGFKLKSLQNSLKSLGIGMIINSIGTIVALVALVIIAFDSDSDNEIIKIWGFAGFFVSIAFYYVFKSCLTDACNHPQKTNNKSWMFLVVAFVGCIIFIIASCDSTGKKHKTFNTDYTETDYSEYYSNDNGSDEDPAIDDELDYLESLFEELRNDVRESYWGDFVAKEINEVESVRVDLIEERKSQMSPAQLQRFEVINNRIKSLYSELEIDEVFEGVKI